MADENYPCSKASYSFFKKRCKAWLNYYGIKTRALFFEHIENKTEYAWFKYDDDGDGALFGLATEFESLTRDDIKNEGGIQKFIDKCAFHEVTECLLSRLRTMMESPDENEEEEVDRAIHNVISTFENTVFHDLRELV